VVSFQAASSLVLTNFTVPFIAVVAKTVKFVDPRTNNGIITEENWSPTRYQPPNPPSPPGKAGSGGDCNAGGTGAHGFPGLPGHPGDSAPRVPRVYLIAGKLVDQNDVPLPQALNFTFDIRGYPGGDGGNGGQGSTGGAGGDGGTSQWGDD